MYCSRIVALLLIGACSMGVCSISAAHAQAVDANWPNKPIHFIVPFPAGAITDLVSRIVANKLSQQLGQPVIIDNRTGASGEVGALALMNSAPDGYTIGLATSSTHAIAASLNPSLSYDPVKDFEPVSSIGDAPYVLVAATNIQAKDVADIVALAKAKPGSLNYSTVGPASLAQFAGALFSSMTGAQIAPIPYRTATQAVIDLAEGRIQMQFGAIAASLSFVKEGKMHAIAVTSSERVPMLPDVPTMAESGLPNYEAVLWMAIVMPPKTPKMLVDRMNKEVRDAVADANVQKSLNLQALLPRSSSPGELRARIGSDIEKWRKIADEAGIKPQ